MPEIEIDGLDAHLAVPPTGEGPWPAVVVLHEMFGLNDDIRAQAGRLAAAGYLALAPDLYTRGGALRCLQGTFRALMKGEGQAFADIEAARVWLDAPRRLHRQGRRHRVLHGRRVRAADRRARLRRRGAQLRRAARAISTPP